MMSRQCSETSVTVCKSTLRNNPKDLNFRTYSTSPRVDKLVFVVSALSLCKQARVVMCRTADGGKTFYRCVFYVVFQVFAVVEFILYAARLRQHVSVQPAASTFSIEICLGD